MENTEYNGIQHNNIQSTGINDKTSFVKKFIDRLENEAQVNTEYLYHVFNGYTDTVLEYINKYY